MKAQIPWLRVFVEGVVIVGSILLAFGIEAWWDGVQERIEEREIIERLISDVRADVQNIERGLSFLPRKEEGLLRVDSLLNAPDPSPQDPVMFLEDVIYGSQYGWSQAVAQRITFDELLGSGAFGLIRDAELRVTISDYYEDHARLQRRIDERETEYPSISYRLVPRYNEFELAPDLSEAQLERLVSGGPTRVCPCAEATGDDRAVRWLDGPDGVSRCSSPEWMLHQPAVRDAGRQ